MTSPAPAAGLRFAKGHGTENDFVLLADVDGSLDLGPELVRSLTDRRAGIGADGVLRAVPSAALAEGRRLLGEEPGAHWFMDYRNADGSVAEMCGNGVRVFAAFLLEQGLAELPTDGELLVATRAGVRRVRRTSADGAARPAGTGSGAAVRTPEGAAAEEWFAVDMGRWHLPGGDEAAAIGYDARVVVPGLAEARPALSVDVGNPHRVLALAGVEELEAADLTVAPQVEPVPPDGANIELVVPLGEELGADGVRRGVLRMRVHERGVGETRSCGTGACAAALAVRTWAGPGAPDEWVVEVPGGRLRVTARSDGHVLLAGPAVIVGDGVVRALPGRAVATSAGGGTLAPRPA